MPTKIRLFLHPSKKKCDEMGKKVGVSKSKASINVSF